MGTCASASRFILAWSLALWMSFLLSTPAFPMDGVFDREAEVLRYLPIVEAGSRRDVIAVARKIYMSGISDERLARALQTRLEKELPTFGAPKTYRRRTMSVVVVENRFIDETDAYYGEWLLHASCSTGAKSLTQTFERIRGGGTRLSVLRAFADYCLQRLNWHRHKNELMASRQYHHPGDDPQVSRLVNLLHAEDPSYRAFVYDYIHYNKLREPRYFEIVSANLLAFIEKPVADQTVVSIARREIELLGDSNDRGHATILRRVLDAKVDSAVKAQARKSLSKLQ